MWDTIYYLALTLHNNNQNIKAQETLGQQVNMQTYKYKGVGRWVVNILFNEYMF